MQVILRIGVLASALSLVLASAATAPASAQPVWNLRAADPPAPVAVHGGAVRLLATAFDRWEPDAAGGHAAGGHAASGLGAAAERVLLDVLPAPLRAACSAMVSRWGADPANTPRLAVRPLWKEPAGRWAVIAYRCGSHHPNYLDRYYDERLAALDLDPDGGTLRVLEDPRACPGCSPLGRFAPAAAVTTHAAHGATLLAIPMTVDSENPCCNGLESSREEREVWLAVSPATVGLAASLILGEETEAHSLGGGGWATVRHAERFRDEDPDQGVRGLVLWHHTRETFWPEAPLPDTAGAPVPMVEPVVTIRDAGTTRLRWNHTGLRFDTIAPGPRPDDDWSRAERAIVRLPASAFPHAPAAVRDSLDALGCLVPQSGERDAPHNLIRGNLAAPDQTDWAALCSRGGESAVVVFWGGPERCDDVLPPTPDHDWLQGVGRGQIAYSQIIGTADPDAIRRMAAAFDGPTPPPMDHQGLNIAFAGKASSIRYCYQGQWLVLQGMD